MVDRHKNFDDPMLSGRDIRQTNYHHLKLLRFFETPFMEIDYLKQECITFHRGASFALRLILE
jgi:hypothetical protein